MPGQFSLHAFQQLMQKWPSNPDTQEWEKMFHKGLADAATMVARRW